MHIFTKKCNSITPRGCYYLLITDAKICLLRNEMSQLKACNRTSGKSAEYALCLINIACKTIKYCLWVINLSWSQYDQIGIKIVGSAMIIMKWKSASSIKPSLKIKRDLQLLVLTTLPILYLDNLKLHLPWKIICYMHWRTKSCEDTSRKLWRSTIEICCHQTFTWVYYLFVDSFPVEWALLN